MFVLRKYQFELFRQRALQQYEIRLCDRLRRVYPDEVCKLKDEQLHGMVSHGTKKAWSYGLESERDVALFIDLMVFLGPSFDEDPSKPWAARILNDEFILAPSLRIDTLHERTQEFLKASEAKAQR